MTQIPLFITNATVTVASNMESEKSPVSMKQGKEFECVELEGLEKKDEKKEKAPRRVIHFSSGETMEEYSTDEEGDEDVQKEPEKRDLLSPVDASKMTWGPYVWFQVWRAATSTVSACDYLGERMASLFGITSAKYQYAIDEYYRIKKEKEEEDMDSHLSEEAERSVEEQQSKDSKQPKIDQPETASPQVLLSNDSPSILTTVSVPAMVTST